MGNREKEGESHFYNSYTPLKSFLESKKRNDDTLTHSDKMAELYCLCQEPADDRFMIACDKCEEWLHGECINVKESEAGNIKYYYCPKCCKRDPTLKTKYRKKKDKKLDKERKKEKKRDSPPSKPKKSRIIL